MTPATLSNEFRPSVLAAMYVAEERDGDDTKLLEAVLQALREMAGDADAQSWIAEARRRLRY